MRTPKRVRASLSSLWSGVTSATFWFVLLGACGMAFTSMGVGVQYGRGHGLIVFGVLCLVACELVRRGMMRA